jgi:hypothetical protein
MITLKNQYRSLLFVLSLAMFFCTTANAQLARERAQTNDTVDRLFWATTNIGISTVQNVDKNDLQSSIAHVFGLTNGGIDRFFGLDDGANTRLGLDYGITDNVSLGIGRMTFNKIVDIRSKYNLLRQTKSNSVPIDLAIKASIGINTTSGLGFEFGDRLSYFASAMIARKFDALSLQLTPMFAHFNTTSQVNPDQLVGLGLLMNYELNRRYALSAEYLPVIGDRFTSTYDAAAIALNIDTGGHIFQLFLASSQWHNEQFIMANNRDRFWKGDFRFGFNIHRVFGLGGSK